ARIRERKAFHVLAIDCVIDVFESVAAEVHARIRLGRTEREARSEIEFEIDGRRWVGLGRRRRDAGLGLAWRTEREIGDLAVAGTAAAAHDGSGERPSVRTRLSSSE